MSVGAMRPSMSTSVILALAFSSVLQVINCEKIVFYESFADDYAERWIVSENSEGPWKYAAAEGTGDFGLLVSEKAKKYAIATALPEPVDPKIESIVLQYDVRLQNGLDCGGSYLKFLMPQEAGWTPSQFKDDSPYSIMFGPDKCGATNKVHFIFRHKSPKTGEYVEHHLKSPPQPINDQLSHVYTAAIFPNNTLRIMIDGEVKQTADLLSDDFEPPVLPPKTISDPEDTKPEDWDERAKIPDPEAKKPEDWDEDAPREIEDESASKPEGWLDNEPLEVDDPEAEKPSDWDEEEDGEWEPSKVPNPKCDEAPGCGEWKRPTIKNPAYKGKWKPGMIDNPAYKGIWAPRDIDNPDYFHLDRPNLENVAAVGIEIWTMSDGIMFDNILVTDDENAAAEIRETAWKVKFEKEKELDKEKREKEAAERKKALPQKDLKEKMFEILYKIANQPALKSVRPQLIDLIKKGEPYPAAVVSILVGIFALFVATLYSLIPGKKRKAKTTIEKAKKEDISSADDKDATDEGEEGDKKDAVQESSVEDVKEALIEEIKKDEAEVKEVRRRTRRET
eukprot:jgi/Mesen1/10836/ME000093S10353